MPLTSEIDTDAGLVTTSVTGRPTPPEIRAHQERLAAEPDFDPAFNHLFDLSEVEALDIDAAEIRSLAAEAIFHETSRKAVIAPRTHHFGLSRMYQAHHSAEEYVRVCRSRAEALEWLDAGK
jgi:hypothetical protein